MSPGWLCLIVVLALTLGLLTLVLGVTGLWVRQSHLTRRTKIEQTEETVRSRSADLHATLRTLAQERGQTERARIAAQTDQPESTGTPLRADDPEDDGDLNQFAY
jgi:cytoskeletal protein RodZ